MKNSLPRIAIIGAMPDEIAQLEKLGTLTRKISEGPYELQEINHNGMNCLIGLSGIGKVQAAMLTQYIISTWKPDYFIFTGVAGALNPSYDIGDIVLGVDFIQHDLDVRPLGFQRGEVPYTGKSIFYADSKLLNLAEQSCPEDHKLFRGRILTGDQFITHSEMATHQYMTDELKGDAVEMEGAALAFVASRNDIPFLVIRTISDRADGSAPCDFNRLLPIVAGNSCTIVRGVLDSIIDSLA